MVPRLIGGPGPLPPPLAACKPPRPANGSNAVDAWLPPPACLLEPAEFEMSDCRYCHCWIAELRPPAPCVEDITYPFLARLAAPASKSTSQFTCRCAGDSKPLILRAF